MELTTLARSINYEILFTFIFLSRFKKTKEIEKFFFQTSRISNYIFLFNFGLNIHLIVIWVGSWERERTNIAPLRCLLSLNN